MRSLDLLLRNGRVVDPANGIDGVVDVRVAGGLVDAVGVGLEDRASEVIDCTRMIVAPGLIDLHAHLRSPGFEHKETIATGSAAASAGGFTTVCCMPNTNPPIDSVEVIQQLQEEIAESASVHILPIATISKQRLGLEPVDYSALAGAGALGFSDDGDSTLDSAVMVDALNASRELHLPVMVHCEDRGLMGGVMHEGEVSRELGLKGLPAAAEEIILARDLMLAELTGGWLYALHVSTSKGADMVRQAKRRGVHVTGEVMPHHLLMTDRWVAGERVLENVDEVLGESVPAPYPLAKVNPPLRTAQDTRGLLAALQDGTFDVIATDHAPHTLAEKLDVPLEQAAFGISGFEVALPLVLSLVRAGHLTMTDMIRLMSWTPARLLGLPGGRLSPGLPADIVVFDPDASWMVEAQSLHTKSPNTPLLGMTVRGKVIKTIVGGAVKYTA